MSRFDDTFNYLRIGGRNWYSVTSNEVTGTSRETVGQVERRGEGRWLAKPRNSDQYLPKVFRTREKAAQAASKAFYGHNWSAMS